MKRIGIIQILQESNCFNPVLTVPADFENFGVGTGNAVLTKYGKVGEIDGFLAGLKKWPDPVAPVGVLRLQAWSGGPAAQGTMDWFAAMLTRQLKKAGRLDGLLVALHGAMLGENEPDLDGWLLEQIRGLTGPDLPIVASLDLHAYVTGRMIRCASALVAYHTFPHLDQRETGVRAAKVLHRIFSGARPVSSLVRLPMITGGELQSTFVPPLAPIFKRLRQAERRKEVLSAAILMTQAYLDVPKLGWSVLIVTDNQPDRGNPLAGELAAMCWPIREQLVMPFLKAPACLDRALKCKGRPVVIADGADATNSGGGGDSVHWLKAMIGRSIPGGALTIMVDPQAVAHAHKAGTGGAFVFAVGGKRDHVFSKPMKIRGRVKSLHRKAGYVLTGHGGNNLKINMGRAAVVHVADVTLLLVEKPGPGSTPLMYRCVGLEPKNFKIVIVKSPAGFRAEFGPFAADIILSDCPGCASSRFASLPYRTINRPLWPLDQIDDWRAVDWIKSTQPAIRPGSTLKSQYDKARAVLPGGVNSSVRLNRALGTPFYVSGARGSRVWSIEGREFIDMCCAHGAALLGHAHPAVERALHQAMAVGLAHSFETEYHEELARKLCACIPCAERIRFCSSGTEATLHLIRACRAFTGRDKIIRVEGHFHGYHELIYIGGQPPAAAFAGNRTHPYIETPGIPAAFADFIIPVPFNDVEAMARALTDHGQEAAMVIMEPINYNSGCIKPRPGYLEAVRQLTRAAGVVLFFDEIQSAFKKSPGGAQGDLGVTPDVCTVGKAIGGGLPLSAFCGRADIMDLFQPVGPVQHSGTFNAQLVPVLAGLAFLEEAAKPGFYHRLRKLERLFHAGMDRIIQRHDLNMVVPHHGARFNILLGRRTPAVRYEDTFCHDKALMLKIVKGCYDRGVYFHDYGGGPAHHGYSVQHTLADINRVLDVMDDVLGKLKQQLG